MTEPQQDYIEDLLERLDITLTEALDGISAPFTNLSLSEIDSEIASDLIEWLLQQELKR